MTKHTPEALAVLPVARKEAQRLGFPFIQREQLFLGLLQDPTVARILTDLGLDLESTRQQVEERLVPGLGAPEDPDQIGMLPTAEQVFTSRAQTAATLLGHTLISPEHLLLGFLMEQHGAVLEVLTAAGITKQNVMELVSRSDTQRGLS